MYLEMQSCATSLVGDLILCLGTEKTKMLHEKEVIGRQITASSGRDRGQNCNFGIKGKLHVRGCILLTIMMSVLSGECTENRRLF